MQIISTVASCRWANPKKPSYTRTAPSNTRCATTTTCPDTTARNGIWVHWCYRTAPKCASSWRAKCARNSRNSSGSTLNVRWFTGGRTSVPATGRAGSSKVVVLPTSRALSRPECVAAPQKNATWSSCAGTANAGILRGFVNGFICITPSWHAVSADALPPSPIMPIEYFFFFFLSLSLSLFFLYNNDLRRYVFFSCSEDHFTSIEPTIPSLFVFCKSSF